MCFLVLVSTCIVSEHFELKSLEQRKRNLSQIMFTVHLVSVETSIQYENKIYFAEKSYF
jgi:hypothetical protein